MVRIDQDIGDTGLLARLNPVAEGRPSRNGQETLRDLQGERAEPLSRTRCEKERLHLRVSPHSDAVDRKAFFAEPLKARPVPLRRLVVRNQHCLGAIERRRLSSPIDGDARGLL